MTLYEFLKFVHVVMVIIWVGGGLAIQALALKARFSDDPVETAHVSGNAEWMGLRVFMPASLLALGAGIWATAEGNLEFGEPWISIGFAAFIVSFFLGMGFLGPESGRIKQLSETKGAADPEVTRRVSRILLVSRLELIVLLAAVWAMVVKPG